MGMDKLYIRANLLSPSPTFTVAASVLGCIITELHEATLQSLSFLSSIKALLLQTTET